MDRTLFLCIAIMAFLKAATADIITCGDSITIDLDSSDSTEFDNLDGDVAPYIFYVGDSLLDYSEIEALSSDCKPTAADGNNLDFSWTLGDCSPTMQSNDTHIVYQHSIWHVPMGNESSVPTIARYEISEYQFSCVFERFLYNETDADTPITPNVIHTTNVNDDVEGDFTFSIDLTNEYYNETATGSVDVDDWIYVAVYLDTTGDSDVFVEFVNCWAHSEASGGGLEYVFVQDGCAVNSTWDESGSIMIEQSGEAQEGHVKVKSWVWNDGSSGQEIYITCSINACRDSCDVPDSACAENTLVARRRRRRSISGENKSRFDLMAGPLKIMLN